MIYNFVIQDSFYIVDCKNDYNKEFDHLKCLNCKFVVRSINSCILKIEIDFLKESILFLKENSYKQKGENSYQIFSRYSNSLKDFVIPNKEHEDFLYALKQEIKFYNNLKINSFKNNLIFLYDLFSKANEKKKNVEVFRD
jgi:hypothetical protein